MQKCFFFLFLNKVYLQEVNFVVELSASRTGEDESSIKAFKQYVKQSKRGPYS